MMRLRITGRLGELWLMTGRLGEPVIAHTHMYVSHTYVCIDMGVEIVREKGRSWNIGGGAR